MFILANLIVAVAKILSIVLSIYMWIIIIQAILSWVNPAVMAPNPFPYIMFSIMAWVSS